MKPENRRYQILSMLRAIQREMKVEELADMMNVSPLTIRRDLDQLAVEKTIIRTHGGCLSVGRAALETEYHKKVGRNFDLKQSIGSAAADIVEDGDVLLLNDGTTTFHLATQLAGRKDLTIYTNSLALISEISRNNHIKLYIIGGEYNNENYSLRGSLLEQTLEGFTFDKVFLGADAIDAEGKCMVGSVEEARLTKIMLKSGRKRILLADHTKTEGIGRCAYGSLEDFDLWITTSGLDPDLQSAFASLVKLSIT